MPKSTPSRRRREGAQAYYGQTEAEAREQCPYTIKYKFDDWMQGWNNARIVDEAQQNRPRTRDELFLALLDLVEDIIRNPAPAAVPELLEKHNEIAMQAQETMT